MICPCSVTFCSCQAAIHWRYPLVEVLSGVAAVMVLTRFGMGPVGLVYLALATPDGTQVVEKRYLGEREAIRWQATQTALDLVRRWLREGLRSSGNRSG